MVFRLKDVAETYVQPVCNDCGGTVIEYDHAAGNGFCIKCGTVVEENAIVNEVAFGETSNGAAMVQGSFVGQGASECRCVLFTFKSDLTELMQGSVDPMAIEGTMNQGSRR